MRRKWRKLWKRFIIAFVLITLALLIIFPFWLYGKDILEYKARYTHIPDQGPSYQLGKSIQIPGCTERNKDCPDFYTPEPSTLILIVGALAILIKVRK